MEARDLETHQYPCAGRFKAMGSESRPCPVSRRLG